MEQAFQEGQYLRSDTKHLLVKKLGKTSLGRTIELRNVQQWFAYQRTKLQNQQRSKNARDMLEEVDRSEASSQGNLNPYPQSVQPQGLAAATNNFGANIPQRPLGARDLIDRPQGNSNPLPQPPHSQVQRVEHAVVQTPVGKNSGKQSKPFKSFSSNQRSILENFYKRRKVS